MQQILHLSCQNNQKKKQMKRDFPVNIFRNNLNTFRRIPVFLVFPGMFRKSLDEIRLMKYAKQSLFPWKVCFQMMSNGTLSSCANHFVCRETVVLHLAKMFHQSFHGKRFMSFLLHLRSTLVVLSLNA